MFLNILRKVLAACMSAHIFNPPSQEDHLSSRTANGESVSQKQNKTKKQHNTTKQKKKKKMETNPLESGNIIYQELLKPKEKLCKWIVRLKTRIEKIKCIPKIDIYIYNSLTKL